MIDVLILAAGKGTRMQSSLPKVIQPLSGQPMLSHLLETTQQLNQVNMHVIVGFQADKVMNAFDQQPINWILQEQQLGTGHAVQQALTHCHDDSQVLILYGDVPLVKHQTMVMLLENAKQSGFAMLTVNLDQPYGYGRIVRDHQGQVMSIAEEKDATLRELEITECNTGIMAVSSCLLKKWLPNLSNQNAQKEYYLTDIVAMAVKSGVEIFTSPADPEEVLGVNDRVQLAQLERILQKRRAAALLQAGVTLIDPARIDIRGEVTVGQDVVIDCNVIFEGKVVLGDGVSIAANCVIRNATIGNDVTIEAFSHIDMVIVGDHACIGPYARIRPGTVLSEKTKVGNFVEIKKSTIGAGTKINHLSYIGDAIIESNVNVGAGTITCNYDGKNKHQTVIKDSAFIGSNVSLVAPVEIGKAATVGAGSTITKDVPDEQLALTRSRQINMPWQSVKSKLKCSEEK